MADHDMAEGIELSDELLEGIAGGVLSEDEKAAFSAALATWKSSGFTLEQALHAYRRGNRMAGDPADYVEYANSVWDSL
ncbi:MAG: hypothetical protein Q4D39_02405 [Coriobacteriaceae bacterium]|nr:hypothetical protein [Coriobacteriaceae bacterium]